MRFLFRAGALMLNITLKTVQMTEPSQILTYPGVHRGVQVCGLDLLGPRRRPLKAGHSPPPRLRCCQRRRQRLWREGAASGEAFLQRHGSQWLAAGAVTSWRGRCGAPPTAAAGYVRRVDRDPAAFAPARAHRSATRSATQGHGHMGVQPCKEKRAHMLCDNVSMFESLSSLTVDHSIK